VGKSALLRAIAGLWPFGRGEIELGRGRILFVPQAPYVPLGTSWEEDDLGQGIFTFALLKALQEGGCATARQINSYLKVEVAALSKRFGKTPQTPWLVAEPIEIADLILSLKNARKGTLTKAWLLTRRGKLER
jgi:uncharacterized caspase-like protein